MRRPLIGLEKPKLVPPPKPKAPEEPDEVPDDIDDKDEQAMYEMEKAQHEYEMEKAQHDADLGVWKEEVKLVARRRMEHCLAVLEPGWLENRS
jgi:hypothetical protein